MSGKISTTIAAATAGKNALALVRMISTRKRALGNVTAGFFEPACVISHNPKNFNTKKTTNTKTAALPAGASDKS
jgi:hypothetical protein